MYSRSRQKGFLLHTTRTATLELCYVTGQKPVGDCTMFGIRNEILGVVVF